MAIFRAKARAIDLLGKGQISDLPTAISELWKNGYDAYGDNLHASLYQKGYVSTRHPFLVISDDGKGMSREDILDKWIVLGTDSKSRNTSDLKGEETLWKEPRIKMGEKGIGRLSVAYLGSPMLMLTKKIGHPLQAVFIDWRTLENYNLFIEDVQIPLRAIANESMFETIFENLKNEFLDNFKENKSKSLDQNNLYKPWLEQKELALTIIDSINNIFLPSYFIEDFVKPMCDSSSETHGTKFFIFQPDEQLLALSPAFDQSTKEEYNSTVIEIRNSLNGLFNVFKEDNIAVNTQFMIYSKEGIIDLIASRDFFTPEDYSLADYLIEGNFDDTGKFEGKVRVYDEEHHYEFRSVREPGKTKYGFFSIKIGASPGLPTESRLNEEQYSVLVNKLKSFGGLYIYRDGFRVLPYGRLNADFLEFEERRSRHAGNYFFSYRRMFGYIEVSREHNSKLIDKAGREGFVNNAAYKAFKKDLIAFFIDLGNTYFGTHATSDSKRVQQDNLKKIQEIEQKEKNREKEHRKIFAKKLNENVGILDQLRKEHSDLIAILINKQNNSNLVFEDLADTLKQIVTCRSKIKGLEIKMPVRFKPTENQNKKLREYSMIYQSFFTEDDINANAVIAQTRAILADYELYKEVDYKYTQYRNFITNICDEASTKISQHIKTLTTQVAEEKAYFLTDLDNRYRNIKPKTHQRSEVEQSLNLLEEMYQELSSQLNQKLEIFINYIKQLHFDIDEDSLIGYYKIRYEEIEKQWEQTKELAQMGIAVEIVDHQFNALYSQVAYSIKSIKHYLVNDNKSLENYNTLESSFQHLEDKYKLMSPLYRTTGKTKANISGQNIKEYLLQFFSKQLSDLHISLASSSDFDKSEYYTYKSILIPAIVNVIHNAIYWLGATGNRKIYLDFVENSKLLIANSGPLIEDYYLEDIFKLFYSKKPSGRGIGLFLAKDTLRSVGFDIYASNDRKYNVLNGACFIIDIHPNEV